MDEEGEDNEGVGGGVGEDGGGKGVGEGACDSQDCGGRGGESGEGGGGGRRRGPRERRRDRGGVVMMWPDAVNGAFELLGGAFIAQSILKLHREKMVRGVSWLHAGFFSVWGFWNLFYYPHLDQWLSFAGGVGIVTANTIWLGQLIWYSRA